MTPAALAKRNRTRILLAFAAVYVLWGSTYLFIRFAIETIPPFILGATRFVMSSSLLYAFARWRGAPKPTAREWRSAAITGVLMLGLGNGAVMWSEKSIPSGIVALIVSSVPIWIVVLDWLRPDGVRPRKSVLLGLLLGFIGMVILVGPRAVIGQGHVDGVAAAILIGGSISWAVGSLLTRGSTRPGSPLVYAAVQMGAASIAMLILSLVTGEPSHFTWSAVSTRSMVSWVYLVLFGSIVGYTAYIYLLGAVSAAKAATYAYVNPVIAVLLGWAFASEPLGVRTMLAAAVILAGVAIITAAQGSGAHASGEHPLPTESREQRPAA